MSLSTTCRSVVQKSLFQHSSSSYRRTSSTKSFVTVHKTTASSSSSATTFPYEGGGISHAPQQQQQVSTLVDNLLVRTRELMDTKTHHVVAYSGGIDSSLVAALLQQVYEPHKGESLQAVLGLSPAVSQEQLHQARSVADHLQLPLVELTTDEGTDTTYIANEGKACLACKTHLYTSLETVADFAALQQQEVGRGGGGAQLYNGTNADDLQDSTRVGLIAAQNFQVVSPLSSITKEQVRIVAKHLGLPNWNAAASPCLRSRLALGVEATKHHLQMIEQAERHVRLLIKEDVDESSNVRVRMLAGQRAMIEVDDPNVPKVHACLEELQPYFQSLGFKTCAVRAFKTGSVSRKVNDTTTTTPTTTNIPSQEEMQMRAATA